MALDLDMAGSGDGVRLAPGLLAAALTSLTSLGNAAGQFAVMARIMDPKTLVARPGVHFGHAVEEATGRIIPPDGGPPRADRPILVSVRIDLPGDAQAPLQARIAALRDILLDLSADGFVTQAEQVARSSLLRSIGEMRARPEDLARLPGVPPGIDGQGVMVGVVDFGCDFAHPAFRDAGPGQAGPGTTRLRLLWDQNGTPPPGHPLPGRIITPAEINTALATADPYAALGYVPWENGYGTPPPEKRLEVHGTHVLGIAAGRHPGPRLGRVLGAGVAPGAALGFVHLRPRALISDGDATDVLDGVCLLFQAAHDAGMACVVNLSLGANTGGHDGMGLLDQALDALLAVPGRAITVAAGNNQTAGIAWRGKVSAANPVGFGWRFRAADASANVLRVYAAHGGPMPPPVLTLTRPDGTLAVDETAMQQGAAVIPDAKGGIAGLYSFLFLAPSMDGPLSLHEIRLLPSGRREVWQVGLTLPIDGGLVSDFDAWIERDDVADSNMSRFEPLPAGTVLGCTLGSLACATRPICVGAYDRDSGGAAGFSSRGPTRVGEQKPDLVAPGTNIIGPAARGGQGSQFPAGFRASGTSAAAPHVAGLVALMFQLRPRLTADHLREILRATTLEAQANPTATWEPGMGCGRADARAALAMTLLEPA